MVAALMLRAPSEAILKAKEELSSNGYTSVQLASELGIAVQLVDNFLNGEIVDRNTYNLVCDKLHIPINSSEDQPPKKSDNLSSQDIADSKPAKNELTNGHAAINDKEMRVIANFSDVSVKSENIAPIDDEIDYPQPNQFVQKIRRHISSALIRQCDRLRVIDINTPLYLHDLYTDIEVFIDLPSSQYLDLNETFQNIPPEQYDRFYLAKLNPSSIPANQALEEYNKLLVTGSLGAGKTTLLKYWALACITDQILSDYLPIFLPLRSLVDTGNFHGTNSLGNPFTWLKSQFTSYGLANEILDGASIDNLLEQLLSEGNFLLLWDGLDEIPDNYRTEIAYQILNFSDLYPKNRMVVATRNPVYSHILESFKTIEVAPFQESQIAEFAGKWVQTTCPQLPKKLDKFQQLLNTNQPLAEVAKNPLLLTHICTAFNSCEYLKPNFYQEILNLLLSKWEQTKCLPSSTNQSLSVAQKQDLLSYIAIVSLDRHGYVWQNNELEDDFQACIRASRNLANVAIDRDQFFQLLKWRHSLLIESAKGVHRLCHTTLHDYLAAYRIANSNPAAAQKYLLERMYLNRWHGVIVMTVSISQQADHMLQMMKRKIDELVIKDPHLQSFLSWVNQQSIQMKTPYKAVTIRALYLDIDLENTRSLDRARALDIAHSRSLERARTKALGFDNTMETEVDIDYTINLALNLDLALYFANHRILDLACILEPDLHKGLQFLRQKFPDPYKDREKFSKWWQAKGLDWSKKLRSLIVQHRKGSQEWQFSENQLKILRTYHDANKLLVECLNNAEYVSPLVKNQIESTLLSPQGEYTILQY
ncbi:NACHT domain-containing protein [Pseudanabaena yagii]|uniref:NACHT domain-containing protein n=1 Tax=Pseudanabaena yagii GIHE-NHR1 TaxID=2722753 RepID=A0ABX1LZ82_9CYAN|nr:NACHT domain-containing protein [Pseudanabaena yagii]NMF60285.1 NACHT domain-containing protein [Pseudanabaena yagii GIHE-NHR1]